MLWEIALEFEDALHHPLEHLLLATQFLGSLGVFPDVGGLERAFDFDQAGSFDIEVKDTPVVRVPDSGDR